MRKQVNLDVIPSICICLHRTYNYYYINTIIRHYVESEMRYNIIVRCGIFNLDSEADEAEYDVIHDLKAGILPYQLLKLFAQRNVLKIHSHKITPSEKP